jgi:hypothetical protein
VYFNCVFQQTVKSAPHHEGRKRVSSGRGEGLNGETKLNKLILSAVGNYLLRGGGNVPASGETISLISTKLRAYILLASESADVIVCVNDKLRMCSCLLLYRNCRCKSRMHWYEWQAKCSSHHNDQFNWLFQKKIRTFAFSAYLKLEFSSRTLKPQFIRRACHWYM